MTLVLNFPKVSPNFLTQYNPPPPTPVVSPCPPVSPPYSPIFPIFLFSPGNFTMNSMCHLGRKILDTEPGP